MGERFDVFVSYGHADQVWARALVENLHGAGLSVFFDDWEIAPGDRWVERLEAGVAGSAAAVVVCSANLAQLRGDYQAAEDRNQQALVIFKELGDLPELAAIYGRLGNLAQVRKDYSAAEERYRQALSIQRRVGDRVGLATTYSNLGVMAKRRGNYPAAEASHRQALAIREELDDRAGLATTYSNLGILADRRGDYPAAEAYYQQALAIFEELGDRAGLATVYVNLGNLRTAQDRPADGVSLTLAGFLAFLELGSPDAATALGVLRAQRERLGDDTFFEIVRGLVDEDSLSNLTEMLDGQSDSASVDGEGPADAAPGP